MRDVAKTIGGVLAVAALVFLFVVAPIWYTFHQEGVFRDECYSVSGVVVNDDGELECHVGGQEIAEFGENSPRQPQQDED
jgi:hypothetical protein